MLAAKKISAYNSTNIKSTPVNIINIRYILYLTPGTGTCEKSGLVLIRLPELTRQAVELRTTHAE